MLAREAADRSGASPRVQRDQQIAGRAAVALGEHHLVAKTPENASPAESRHPVALPGASRSRRDDADTHGLLESRPRSRRAGAEAGPNVASVWPVEVAPAVPDQARARGPTASAQYLVRAEPGFGVLPVRIDDEAGIRQEVRGGPLPDVADQLPASGGAVAGGQRIYRHRR